jgi:hypothetical protein
MLRTIAPLSPSSTCSSQSSHRNVGGGGGGGGGVKSNNSSQEKTGHNSDNDSDSGISVAIAEATLKVSDRLKELFDAKFDAMDAKNRERDNAAMESNRSFLEQLGKQNAELMLATQVGMQNMIQGVLNQQAEFNRQLFGMMGDLIQRQNSNQNHSLPQPQSQQPRLLSSSPNYIHPPLNQLQQQQQRSLTYNHNRQEQRLLSLPSSSSSSSFLSSSSSISRTQSQKSSVLGKRSRNSYIEECLDDDDSEEDGGMNVRNQSRKIRRIGNLNLSITSVNMNAEYYIDQRIIMLMWILGCFSVLMTTGDRSKRIAYCLVEEDDKNASQFNYLLSKEFAHVPRKPSPTHILTDRSAVCDFLFHKFPSANHADMHTTGEFLTQYFPLMDEEGFVQKPYFPTTAPSLVEIIKKQQDYKNWTGTDIIFCAGSVQLFRKFFDVPVWNELTNETIAKMLKDYMNIQLNTIHNIINRTPANSDPGLSSTYLGYVVTNDKGVERLPVRQYFSKLVASGDVPDLHSLDLEDFIRILCIDVANDNSTTAFFAVPIQSVGNLAVVPNLLPTIPLYPTQLFARSTNKSKDMTIFHHLGLAKTERELIESSSSSSDTESSNSSAVRSNDCLLIHPKLISPLEEFAESLVIIQQHQHQHQHHHQQQQQPNISLNNDSPASFSSFHSNNDIDSPSGSYDSGYSVSPDIEQNDVELHDHNTTSYSNFSSMIHSTNNISNSSSSNTIVNPPNNMAVVRNTNVDDDDEDDDDCWKELEMSVAKVRECFVQESKEEPSSINM